MRQLAWRAHCLPPAVAAPDEGLMAVVCSSNRVRYHYSWPASGHLGHLGFHLRLRGGLMDPFFGVSCGVMVQSRPLQPRPVSFTAEHADGRAGEICFVRLSSYLVCVIGYVQITHHLGRGYGDVLSRCAGLVGGEYCRSECDCVRIVEKKRGDDVCRFCTSCKLSFLDCV